MSDQDDTIRVVDPDLEEYQRRKERYDPTQVPDHIANEKQTLMRDIDIVLTATRSILPHIMDTLETIGGDRSPSSLSGNMHDEDASDEYDPDLSDYEASEREDEGPSIDKIVKESLETATGVRSCSNCLRTNPSRMGYDEEGRYICIACREYQWRHNEPRPMYLEQVRQLKEQLSSSGNRGRRPRKRKVLSHAAPVKEQETKTKASNRPSCVPCQRMELGCDRGSPCDKCQLKRRCYYDDNVRNRNNNNNNNRRRKENKGETKSMKEVARKAPTAGKYVYEGYEDEDDSDTPLTSQTPTPTPPTRPRRKRRKRTIAHTPTNSVPDSTTNSKPQHNYTSVRDLAADIQSELENLRGFEASPTNKLLQKTVDTRIKILQRNVNSHRLAKYLADEENILALGLEKTTEEEFIMVNLQACLGEGNWKGDVMD